MDIRLSARSGFLAGLGIAGCGAVEAFTGETAPTSFILALTPALAVPLVVALHARQPAGRFGDVAFFVNLVGLGLFGGAAFTLNMALYYMPGPVAPVTRFAMLGSAVVFAVGSVMFGITLLRARVAARVPSWGYTVFLAVFALIAPLPDSPVTSALHVVSGVSVMWLAVDLDTPVHVART